MRVTRFVVALSVLALSTAGNANAQYQSTPLAVSSARSTDRVIVAAVRTENGKAAELAAADVSATPTALDARNFADARARDTNDGLGRLGYILIGAAIGAGVAGGALLLAKATSDCDCETRDIAMAAGGGAVIGGFIGSVAFGLRKDQGGQGPQPARSRSR
jgi:hypothetical protein